MCIISQVFGLLILLSSTIYRQSYALQCYNCSNISDPDECLSVTECRVGQSCYMDQLSNGQTKTMGCTENSQCGVTAGAAGALVGRDLDERGISACHECCSTDKCNKNLCAHLKPSVCIDDVKFDCALLNTVFNTCQDIHHAKTVCPKFCGLCSLVDGNWAGWSQWSQCDVTCGDGTQSRTRMCTDPAPANGGLNCSGAHFETKACSKELCPVHGGWTKWSDWESCSVTCDIGIARRHRNCSNPVPDRFGDHCFGDTLDDKICTPGPCANGGWTEWEQWSSCTMTCGGGIRLRSRTCTNPIPSTFGANCVGDSSQISSCNNKSCAPKIAFTATSLVNLSPSTGQTMIFNSTLVNEGLAYNTSTGIFTSPVNGTFSFSAQICVQLNHHLYVAITVNGVMYAAAHLYDANTEICDTMVAVALLQTNSKVWLKCTSGDGREAVYKSDLFRLNSFSGYLISI